LHLTKERKKEREKERKKERETDRQRKRERGKWQMFTVKKKRNNKNWNHSSRWLIN